MYLMPDMATSQNRMRKIPTGYVLCPFERSLMGYLFPLPQHDSKLEHRRICYLDLPFNYATFLRLERQFASGIWKAVLPVSSIVQRIEGALRSSHYIYLFLLLLLLPSSPSHTSAEFDLVPIRYFADLHTLVHAAPASIHLFCILSNSKIAYHYHALHQIQLFPGSHSVSAWYSATHMVGSCDSNEASYPKSNATREYLRSQPS